MRKLILLLMLICFAHFSHGQKFKEWFRQKKTQKQYLIEQIAHLKLYLELTEKGYKIAKDGLTMIGDIKNGEFKLHKNYFDTLRVVNRKVLKYDRLKEIGRFYGQIRAISSGSISRISAGGFLTSSELAYLKAVFQRVLGDCDQILLAVEAVTTDGPLSMSDDERIRRIDLLYDQILSNYNFSKAFADEAAVLSAARWKENKDTKMSRGLHGIN